MNLRWEFLGEPSWHLGILVTDAGAAPRWSNYWLDHPCADLAFAWEVGVRAAGVPG